MEHPALVELHDAVVDQVVVAPNGSARIELAHLAVYELRSVERYDIISYQGALIFQGVNSVECRGVIEVKNQVSTILLAGNELRSSEIESLIQQPMLVSALVEILFTNGAAIGVMAGSVSLTLGVRGKVFEEWVGPL